MEYVDSPPATVDTTDHLIAQTGLRSYLTAGSEVVLEETTTTVTRRVIMNPVQQNLPALPAPSNNVPRVYDDSELLYPDFEDFKRAQRRARWSSVPLWVGVAAIVAVASALLWELYRAVVGVGEWLAMNSAAILGVVVGVPALLLLFALLGMLFGGGGKCPGVTVHCPIKH